MAKLLIVGLVVLLGVAGVLCQSPPTVSSYTMHLTGEQQGTHFKGIEFADVTNNRIRDDDLVAKKIQILFEDQQTNVVFTFDRKECNTTCYEGNTCHDPSQKCSYSMANSFYYLDGASLNGQCENGDNQWSHDIEGAGITINYCFSSSNVPSGISATQNSEVVAQLTITKWDPTVPAASNFALPSSCYCASFNRPLLGVNQPKDGFSSMKSVAKVPSIFSGLLRM